MDNFHEISKYNYQTNEEVGPKKILLFEKAEFPLHSALLLEEKSCIFQKLWKLYQRWIYSHPPYKNTLLLLPSIFQIFTFVLQGFISLSIKNILGILDICKSFTV